MTTEIRHRDWSIYREGPDWTFVHMEYDGPEDRRCGTAASVDDAIRAIDEFEDEADDPPCPGPGYHRPGECGTCDEATRARDRDREEAEREDAQWARYHDRREREREEEN